MKQLRVLSIFRSRLSENRGTPIRVRSILTRLDARPDVALTVCTWDERVDYLRDHTRLTNNHIRDLITIFQLIKKNNIDVVIGHTAATAYYLLPIIFFTRAKVLLEMHGFIEEEARLYGSISRVAYWFQKTWLRFFYRQCDAITTCSDTATEILTRDNKRVITIFGGADPALFNPHISSSGLVQRTPDKIIIGYAGNSRLWQGLPFLAAAFAELQKIDRTFELVVVSSEKKHPDMGMGVQILGPLEYGDVPRALIDCDILVIPRPDTEVNRISFPSKLVEFMAMGKPVVAARTSDCHRIIRHGENGLLYDPGDMAALLACFLELRSIDVRERLGYHALQTVQQQLTWDIQVEKIVGLLRTLQ
ncbi:MAG: hypothetical protein A2848_02270 [Candidatus Magasanikbacteria bacterium RIFCSPHIGHO2_01_FULL_50_8]|uniref:Glycosyltransferase subfamily 4-like N-terminal domain-containing protein n=2 Tax=Candidatus Magasanikiibacteriota TaxID=1752731 RepID=A0A1F6LP06_9BACT|nr:MAG: hypothetical protein A2848_02270 [Candidatus Magasanikbacteria bacterium RIFCSPHIGHO2_01_FULL_50_8]OGH67712.1 MAG: hypothetical protein A3C15_01560 [Candidatus Magasanikbacteria bacterium RIFCSPHIGHO2_02_FULL_50_9b]